MGCVSSKTHRSGDVLSQDSKGEKQESNRNTFIVEASAQASESDEAARLPVGKITAQRIRRGSVRHKNQIHPRNRKT
jgi:hypothetical protein